MDLVDRHPLKEKRRANKPLLERKRRARINDSLSDLKHLVLSSLNKDASKYAKMEKVDILDMTVQFLKGRTFEKRKDDYVSVYRAGYSECTKEMYQSIMTMEGVDHALKCRILTNIAANLPEYKMASPPPSPTLSNSSRSPIHSPNDPTKKCVSSLFTPTNRCILPTSFQTPENISNECSLNFHPSTISKNIIRNTNEHLPKLQYMERQKSHCRNHRLYCHSDVAINSAKRTTVGKEVWRPW